MTKRPPLKIPARTKSTRTSVTSTARYSARPPQASLRQARRRPRWVPRACARRAQRHRDAEAAPRRPDARRAAAPPRRRARARSRGGSLSVSECLAQQGAPAQQLDPDRGRWPACDLRDLVHREVVEIPKHDHDPVKLGQPYDGGADARPGLARNRGLLGRRRPVDDLRATLDVYAAAKLA